MEKLRDTIGSGKVCKSCHVQHHVKVITKQVLMKASVLYMLECKDAKGMLFTVYVIFCLGIISQPG